MQIESIQRMTACFVVGFAVTACVAATPKREPSAPVQPAPVASSEPSKPSEPTKEEDKPTLGGELPAPAHFPSEAREMMRARMMRHGESMTFLMAGVIFLAYDDVQSIAFDIAKEPKLGRPAPGEKDTLNALLPVLFFDLQDQLSVRARQLALAAEARDNARLVATFGALAETCVACHAAYLADADEDDEVIAAH